MAANDYEIAIGWRNAYLTKKSQNPILMSEDRRPITDGEILALFEFYLRRWCEDHEDDDTIVVTNSDGKKIFEATLIDKEELTWI